MSDTIQIKKYPNRRLYDTNKSEYITLEDLSEIIRSGHKVEVIDVKTEEDVTAFTLTQIIMNRAKSANSLLPVSLLHLVIEHGETLLQDFFDQHLEQTMDNYLQYRQTMDRQINSYLEIGMDFSSLAEKTFKEMNPMGFFSPTTKNGDEKE